jgi:hypothetical protein
MSARQAEAQEGLRAAFWVEPAAQGLRERPAPVNDQLTTRTFLDAPPCRMSNCEARCDQRWRCWQPGRVSSGFVDPGPSSVSPALANPAAARPSPTVQNASRPLPTSLQRLLAAPAEAERGLKFRSRSPFHERCSRLAPPSIHAPCSARAFGPLTGPPAPLTDAGDDLGRARRRKEVDPARFLKA